MTQRNFVQHLALVAGFATLVSSQAHAAIDVKLTGFIKAGAVGSDRSVQSYGQENYVAPTSARADVAGANTDGGLTVQTAQTRFGFVATADENTKGIFEFDFVDFTKSTSSLGQYPRVRIAKIEHKMSEHTTLQIGQDWDIFSPLNTFTYNYVGNTFQAGNSAFMRQQVVFIHTGEGFEQKAALGMFGRNETAALSDVERSDVPTLAYSAAWGTTPSRLGVSAIVSQFIVRPGGERENTMMYGANFFTEQKWGTFDFRAEAYYGQNMANAGMLTLATRTAGMAEDLQEAGGWISGRLPLGEMTNIFGSVGYASIMNSEDVPVPAPTAVTGTITSNMATKIGVDHKLTDKLSVFGELSHFSTQYKGINDGQATMADVGLFLFL